MGVSAGDDGLAWVGDDKEDRRGEGLDTGEHE